MITLDKIYHTAHILKQAARKTDLIFPSDLCSYRNIWLKTENLQVTGSFKLRGAFYMISQLSEEKKRGLLPTARETVLKEWLWLLKRVE